MPLRGEAANRPTYTGLQNLPGVSNVWIAKHEVLGEKCIQKTCPPAGVEDAIMFAEPRLLNELDHPNITPLREVQFDPDRPGHVTLVMRVYEGGSVLAAMADGGHRFSVGTVISILRDIADALHYLHSTKRYIHRDVKPGNILLDSKRKTGYLSDLGSAAALSATNTGAAIRTTGLYQPPEAAKDGQVGPGADIYALGLVAFEMLNGLLPYATLDAAEVDRRINAGWRALPDRMFAAAAFAPHVPTPLVRLIRRMLESNLDRRVASAAQVVRDLRALKYVDWDHVSGDGLNGEWSGRWPPRRRTEQQIDLRVTSTVLAAGRNQGKRRLVAAYRSATSRGWRTVGVSALTVDAQDATAVSAFFTAVDAKVAKRWPA